MREEVCVVLERLPHAAGLALPSCATMGSAGLDLVAAVPEDEPVILRRWARALIPTGLRMLFPEGYEGQVRPRSGLALHDGITVLNAPGTIDADYRGEIGVILMNCGEGPFVVKRGMRIAQMVIAPVTRVILSERDGDEGEVTSRGSKGFGSTGIV